MGHKIDTSMINIRTDLAIEEEINNKNIIKEEFENIIVSTINIDEDIRCYKKKGKYITIEYSDVTDHENFIKVEEVFIKELTKLLNGYNIKNDDSCLVIGLGNENSTPDCLGPLSINNIIVTNHFYNLKINVDSGFRCVSAINPGVMGQTGIETFDIIKAVVDKIKPDFVIVVDSLKASSVDRVNKTIQITDAGINPGSGIGNNRKEINKELLNVPVFAIGIPTVVDTITIVDDSINYMAKYYSYFKNNINNVKEKLKISRTNFKNYDVSIENKKELFGIFGGLSNEESKSFISEVLIPIGYNMIVTSKDIDFQIKKLSQLIGNGINNVLHLNVTHL